MRQLVLHHKLLRFGNKGNAALLGKIIGVVRTVEDHSIVFGDGASIAFAVLAFETVDFLPQGIDLRLMRLLHLFDFQFAR